MTADRMPVRIVTGLDIYVENFEGKGSEGVGETLGVSGINLYVNVKITTSTGQDQSTRMPSSEDYGTGKELDLTIFIIPIVRGDLTINVSFAAFDKVVFGSDDPLGTLTGFYNAQNLWGIGQVADSWNNRFLATYDIKPHNTYDKAAFRQQMSWGFLNVGTPTLSWEEFAETYTDVSVAENNAGGYLEHPFNHAFFTFVYEGLAASGNCFGMCVESIYAQVGRSLFAEPIVTYPWDTPEIQEVNIKMGYQLGGDLIDWFLGQFIAGNTHNPVNVFNSSRDQYNRGDYPVITLSTDSMLSNGHCVRPYAWYDGDFPGQSDKLVIKVANPDSPAVPSVSDGHQVVAVPDDDPSCLIVIDKVANTFTMLKSSS